MGWVRRLCAAGSACLLVCVLLQSTVSALPFDAVDAGLPSVGHSVLPAFSTPSLVDGLGRSFLSITPFVAALANPCLSEITFPLQGVLHVAAQHQLVAQSDIPQVLTPSLEPPAEPSLYVPPQTPSATPTVNATNETAPLTQQPGISVERLISGIPFLMVVLLAPLLVIIAALFYSLLRAEQEADRASRAGDGETKPTRAVRRPLRARYRKKRHTKR